MDTVYHDCMDTVCHAVGKSTIIRPYL